MDYQVIASYNGFHRIKNLKDQLTTLCSEIYLIGMDTLVDLGSPSNMTCLIEALNSIGIRHVDIRNILLTHTHVDHFGDPSYFPNARILVAERSLDSLYEDPLRALDQDFEYNGLSLGKEAEDIAARINSFRLEPLESSGHCFDSGLGIFLRPMDCRIYIHKTRGHTQEDVSYAYGRVKILGDSLIPRNIENPDYYSFAKDLIRGCGKENLFVSHSTKKI
jgi:glyoxylase-like metal-dependent hydrolase (beta-lactamase superfamily II)